MLKIMSQIIHRNIIIYGFYLREDLIKRLSATDVK